MKYIITFRKFKKHCPYESYDECWYPQYANTICKGETSPDKCTEKDCPILKTCKKIVKNI